MSKGGGTPKPREMFTDVLIKNLKNVPSCTQYNVSAPKNKPPLGKISYKGPGHWHLNDVEYRGMGVPGPATYTPKKDAVLKHFGSLVRLEKASPPTR
jgi:hypothetical protein